MIVNSESDSDVENAAVQLTLPDHSSATVQSAPSHLRRVRKKTICGNRQKLYIYIFKFHFILETHLSFLRSWGPIFSWRDNPSASTK